MIVVDCGCMDYRPGQTSSDYLIERFRPDVLFGFDIHPNMQDGISSENGTTIIRRRIAVATTASIYGVAEKGSGTTLAATGTGPLVHSLALAEFLLALPAPIVLKLDIEGDEYPIMGSLHGEGVDAHLALILVEWHHKWGHDGPLKREFRCPVEEWPL